ncbi:hypothetical protein ACFU6O_00380 [Streptomyces albidoflavus]
MTRADAAFVTSRTVRFVAREVVFQVRGDGLSDEVDGHAERDVSARKHSLLETSGLDPES